MLVLLGLAGEQDEPGGGNSLLQPFWVILNMLYADDFTFISVAQTSLYSTFLYATAYLVYLLGWFVHISNLTYPKLSYWCYTLPQPCFISVFSLSISDKYVFPSMLSGPITSWEIDGETVRDFIFGGSKITADGDCSHEIKRRLFLEGKLWPT